MTCPACKGSKVVKPPGASVAKTCGLCDGTGTYSPSNRCPSCMGLRIYEGKCILRCEPKAGP